MAQEQQKDVPLIALIDAEKKTYLRENVVPLITLIDAEKKTKTYLRKSARSAGEKLPADYADRRRNEADPSPFIIIS